MAGYSLPVSSYGTRLSFDFTDSHVRLGGMYKGIKGNAQSYFFKLTHPLVQTAKSDLFLYSGYDFVNANTTFNSNGAKPVSGKEIFREEVINNPNRMPWDTEGLRYSNQQQGRKSGK